MVPLLIYPPLLIPCHIQAHCCTSRGWNIFHYIDAINESDGMKTHHIRITLIVWHETRFRKIFFFSLLCSDTILFTRGFQVRFHFLSHWPIWSYHLTPSSYSMIKLAHISQLSLCFTKQNKKNKVHNGRRKWVTVNQFNRTMQKEDYWI